MILGFLKVGSLLNDAKDEEENDFSNDESEQFSTRVARSASKEVSRSSLIFCNGTSGARGTRLGHAL